MAYQGLDLRSYEQKVEATRDRRMAWWREARFGMFIHYGLYSVLERHEWALVMSGYDMADYAGLVDGFQPDPDAPKRWAALARRAGMRYAVLTSRHHEGFSLWDSEANPWNAVNYGPKRDIVGEFIAACREEGLGVGLYSSLMDWHHPDGARAAYDREARLRFQDYIRALNRELCTQYGKLDVLWYDVPQPMAHWEGWDSLTLNQMVRDLQPEIILNDRSRLAEDFGTPEERVTAAGKGRDWEACMTFNGLSWGYLDAAQTAPYAYNAHGILRMLLTASAGAGNLLLNIGPRADGAIPEDAIEPLEAVGRWLARHGEACYGRLQPSVARMPSGICGVSQSGEHKRLYLWCWIWPDNGELRLGGFQTQLEGARILGTDQRLGFDQDQYAITLTDLPADCPDDELGVGVIALDFADEPDFVFASRYPQLHAGQVTPDWR